MREIFHKGETLGNYWWYPCPICKKTEINKISESGLVGACAKCRDKTIPNHIPLEQHEQYLKKYLREKGYGSYTM